MARWKTLLNATPEILEEIIHNAEAHRRYVWTVGRIIKIMGVKATIPPIERSQIMGHLRQLLHQLEEDGVLRRRAEVQSIGFGDEIGYDYVVVTEGTSAAKTEYDLSGVEYDFLGDLTRDSHDLWELFQFLGLHEPDLSQVARNNRASQLLLTWLERKWITITDSTGGLMTSGQLMEAVEKQADQYSGDALIIQITESGREYYFHLPPRLL